MLKKINVVSLGLLAIILLYFVFNITAPSSETKTPSTAMTGVGFPARLIIPKINTNVTIEQVGVAPDGTMDVPRQPDDAAWFNLGPRPGEIGSAVIDGHSGWKNFKPAIFDNLSQLKIGDKIYVEDQKGKTVVFVVQGFRTYAPNQNASSVFSSDDNKAHLNLITCSGAWNIKEQTHSNRLVVFTDKE